MAIGTADRSIGSEAVRLLVNADFCSCSKSTGCPKCLIDCSLTRVIQLVLELITDNGEV